MRGLPRIWAEWSAGAIATFGKIWVSWNDGAAIGIRTEKQAYYPGKKTADLAASGLWRTPIRYAVTIAQCRPYPPASGSPDGDIVGDLTNVKVVIHRPKYIFPMGRIAIFKHS